VHPFQFSKCLGKAKEYLLEKNTSFSTRICVIDVTFYFSAVARITQIGIIFVESIL
jgi:hypothetical protein